MVERGVLSFSGARNPNLKIYRHISERGALTKKRNGALSANSKIAQSAERWRPPGGPHLWIRYESGLLFQPVMT